MINVSKLKGIMAERGVSGRGMAKILGMHEQTFYRKITLGKFDSDEMQTMVDVLGITNPGDIFFTVKCTPDVQEEQKWT